jgi:hypothetical protein
VAQIRVVHAGHVPAFPASDQHPDARRYYFFEGGVVPEVEPSPAEAALMARIEADAKDAQERAGNLVRLAEARRAALAELRPEDDANEDAPALVEANEAEASRLARQAGVLEIRLMTAEQRAFLKRMSDRAARAAFIQMTRRERRDLMAQAAPVVYAVDSIGEPTLAEVQAVLTPPVRVDNG